MSVFLGPGIGLALLGAILMGCTGAFLFTYRGTVCQPQDVTAILLAGAVASLGIGRSEADIAGLWPTVLALVITAPIVTAIVVYMAGRMHAGVLARIIPYPVVGGFLAASGYMLLAGALSITIGPELNAAGIWTLFNPDLMGRWAPWIAAGAVLVALARWTDNQMVVPIGIVAIICAFYGTLAFAGLRLEDAQAMGFMLGPFDEDGLIPTDTPALLLAADWTLVMQQVPALIAIACLTALGALLNSTGTELALDRDLDTGKDLRATGLANLAGGLGGGLPGFQLLGETLFAARLGLTGPIAGLAAAAGCATALAFGAGVLEVLPVGLFASVISYLGIDLLITWLWTERRQLSLSDYGLIWLILLIAATVGFLEAFGLGVLIAALIFIFSYARVDILHLRSSAAERRSRVERSDSDVDILTFVGAGAVILEISGYLFFVTANRLVNIVKSEIASDTPPGRIIIDFARVRGLDASAVMTLIRLSRTCHREGVSLVFSGMYEDLRTSFSRRNDSRDLVHFAASLDAALEEYEESVLATSERPGETQIEKLLSLLLEVQEAGESSAVTRLNVAPGEVLISEGSDSSEAYFLLSGSMRAEVRLSGNNKLRVARFQPGSLIGEIAYYANSPRTATIVAESSSELLCVKPRVLESDIPWLANVFHQSAASSLARRLSRMTRLLREAGL